MPGNGRPDVQAHAQPRRGYPQHRQLSVPAARQRVGQVFGQREAIRFLAFHLVVRGHGAQQDLHQEQRHHHPEVFRRGAHGRRDHHRGQRIGGRQLDGRFFLAVVHRVVPAQQRDAGNQEQHAEHRPQEQARRRRVAHQRLVRPVVGVGDVLARALGGGRPGRPPVEGRHRAAVAGVGDGVVLHRVVFAQLGRGGVVAQQALVVRRDVGDGHRALVVDHHRPRGGVVGVRAHHGFQAGREGGLFRGAQGGIAGRLVVAPRPLVEDVHGLAVQPVRGPVRRHVAAVAPDRAQLLAARGLPDLAAGFDVGAGEHHLAAAGDHLLGHRRHFPMDLAADPQQDGKRDAQQDRQCDP